MTESEATAIAHTDDPADAAPTVVPATDIFESDDEYLLVADFPGVSRDVLSVGYTTGELILEGRPAADAGRTAKLLRRAFRVPDTVDPEHISADLKHGVLSVHLRKSEATKPRQIKVST